MKEECERICYFLIDWEKVGTLELPHRPYLAFFLLSADVEGFYSVCEICDVYIC
jgi:hypothetical protein